MERYYTTCPGCCKTTTNFLDDDQERPDLCDTCYAELKQQDRERDAPRQTVLQRLKNIVARA